MKHIPKMPPVLKEVFQVFAGSTYIIFGGNGQEGAEIASAFYDRAARLKNFTVQALRTAL